jgi:transcriptional regulator with XRE-family HTH domain
MAKPSKKDEAIALLAKNITQTRTAQLLDIDRRTLTRWLKQDDFRRKLNETRRNHLENTLDKILDDSPIAEKTENENGELSQLDNLLAKALATLDSIIGCPESRSSDRLKATELILKLIGTDRIQKFTGTNSDGLDSSVGEGQDRNQEIERLLERREMLRNRIAFLKN